MEDNTGGVRITGTGSYLPKKILTNFDLEKIVNTTDEWITVRTGIKERHIAADNEASSDLGIQAAKKAITQAKISPEQIDLIIVATITPDTLFPSTACIIQHQLGAKNAAAFDINAACTGFIYALATANSFLKSGVYQTVLVIATEVLSRITDWQDRSTCILLGDGAGAAVLQRVAGEKSHFKSFYLTAEGEYADLLNLPAGGSRLPTSTQTVQDRLHFLKMKGNEVFKVAVQSMLNSAKKALKLSNVACQEIKLLIPHQANLRIINAISERLGLSSERVFLNIHKYGNMSAATTAVGLDEALQQGLIKPGDIVELVAFGSGFTSGACVIQW